MPDDSVLLGQLAEEFSTRARQGQLPNLEDYAARHPQLAERIRSLFPTLLLLEGLAGGGAAEAGTTPAPEELRPGSLFGAYRLERELGRGGMGVVYEAVHRTLNRRVALKVLPIQGPQQAKHLERFLREAQTAAGLHHTNIVPVFDVGQIGGVPYYAMQYIAGRNLDQLHRPEPTGSYDPERTVDQPGRAAASQPPVGRGAGVAPAAAPPDHYRWVADVGIQAAEGLAYAHQRGVIHRDVKPSNLLLDEQGVVWITDFGLARRLDDVSLTQTGTHVGTPRYMSPEQAEAARQPVDHRTDVYSLGATLYELLTRRPAFDGRTPQELLAQILQREPVPPRRLDRKVPRDLETIVLKAMAKRPADRYQTAAELAEDLRRFLRFEPIRARRIGPLGRTLRWARRNRAAAALVAVTVLAAAVVTAVGLVYDARLHDALGDAAGKQLAANLANQEAGERREEATKTRAQSQQLLGQTYVAAGFREEERGNAAGALTFFAAAVKADPDDPVRAEMHRRRFRAFALQFPRPVQAFFHDGTVNAAAFSPDGHRVVTGSSDTTARVWDLATGRAVCPPLQHAGEVTHALFSPDGRLVLTASKDGLARLWNATTGQPIVSPLRHFGPVHTALFSPDGRLVLTSSDAPLVPSGTLPTFWAREVGRAAAPAQLGSLSISLALVVSLTASGTEARVWDVATGQPLTPPLRSQEWGDFVAFSADSQRVLSTRPEAAQVWEARTGRSLTPPLVQATGTLAAAVFSPDGRQVLAWGGDWKAKKGEARVWNATTGEAMTPPLKHDASVGHAEFSPDSQRFVTVSVDGTFRIWDASTGHVVGQPHHEVKDPLPPDVNSIQFAHFSPDGRRLLTLNAIPYLRSDGAGVGNPGEARLWHGTTGHELTTSPIRTNTPIEQVHFSSDGQRLLLASWDAAQIWDACTGLGVHSGGPFHSGGPVSPLLPFDRSVILAFSLAFSSDGRHVLERRQDEKQSLVRVWDVIPRQPVATLVGDEGCVYQEVALSPDGRYLFTAGGGPTVTQKPWARIWEVATGRSATANLLPREYVQRPRFSPDGRHVVAYVYPSGHFRLWHAPSGRSVLLPQSAKTMGGYAEFSPDGRSLLTLIDQQEVCVWDLKTYWHRFPPLKEGDGIKGAGFSPDGHKLISRSYRTLSTRKGSVGEARVWDAATGQPLTQPMVMEGPIDRAEFSPDSCRLLTVSYRYTRKGGSDERIGSAVRVWDAATGQPLTPVLPHEDARIEPVLSPDGTRLLTRCTKDAVRVWDAGTGQPVTPPLPHDIEVWWGAIISPDGLRLVTASISDRVGKCTVRVWDATTGQALTPPIPHWIMPRPTTTRDRWGIDPPPLGWAPLFSPDGRRLVTAINMLQFQVWEATNGQPVGPPSSGQCLSVSEISSDGRRLLTGGLSLQMCIRDLATGRPLTPMLKGDWLPRFLGPNGNCVVSFGNPKVRLWDVSADVHPVGDLVRVAQLLTTQNLDDADNVTSLSVADYRRAWDELRQKYPHEFASTSADDMLAWHRAEAFEAEVAKEWFAARWHLDRLLRAEPQVGVLHARRANALGELGNLDQAAADCTKAIECGEETPTVWYHLALLRLRAGEGPGYRQACEAVQRITRTELESRPNGSGLPTCAIGPNGLADPNPVLKLLEANLKKNEQDAGAQRAYGATLYRAGRFEEAVRRLDQAVRIDKNGGTAWDWLFLAMARHRLGQTAEARRCLDKAGAKSADFERDRQSVWDVRLELRLLREEAEAVLKEPAE